MRGVAGDTRHPAACVDGHARAEAPLLSTGRRELPSLMISSFPTTSFLTQAHKHTRQKHLLRDMILYLLHQNMETCRGETQNGFKTTQSSLSVPPLKFEGTICELWCCNYGTTPIETQN